MARIKSIFFMLLALVLTIVMGSPVSSDTKGLLSVNPSSAAVIFPRGNAAALDGCHRHDDSWGIPCAFSDSNHFMASGANACRILLKSWSQGIRRDIGAKYCLPDQDDEFGGKQMMCVGYRVDRGDTIFPSQQDCEGDMSRVYNSCNGWGGWVNTAYGTVFGECILQNR
ncbi:hypothetical protein EJ08DRAFT_651837 [Tothia fuscella]|uniref:Uncharacterized protein n=1 Tax=Tothia fuscella TaxID=1048955 RepID=A0A9P4TVY8_9PEZI|nr:hypothetical protein EJ08DRAFT_651837 [Tothia fuscella]